MSVLWSEISIITVIDAVSTDTDDLAKFEMKKKSNDL